MNRSVFFFAALACVLSATAGCAGKQRRTVCVGAALDCMCSTSVTSDTHTFDCSVTAHPEWTCCQSNSTTDCSCRPAACAPSQTSVEDCRVSSNASTAALVSGAGEDAHCASDGGC